MSQTNDLDSLLMELDGLDKRASKAPAPQAKRASAVISQNSSQPPKRATQNDWDELDALVAKFEDTNSDEPTPIKPPQVNDSKRSTQVLSSQPASRPTSVMQNRQSIPPAPSFPARDSAPSNPPLPNRDLRSSQRISVYNPQTTLTTTGSACGSCGQAVTGEHIMALGKTWHPNHFTCAQCGLQLRGDFYEHDGKHSCKSCIESKFRCTKCGNAITGEYFIGNGKMLHPQCLDTFPCAKCGQSITTSDITALDKHYHPDCFTCTGCNYKLQGTFYARDNMPFCNNCANVSGGSGTNSRKCTSCGQIITGTYVNYENRDYHPGCFVCTSCRGILPHESFYTVGGQPHCENCAKRATGQ